MALGAHSAADRLYDVVILDAFDGQNCVPEILLEDEFARLVAMLLHPLHGTLLTNLIPPHTTSSQVSAAFKQPMLNQDGVEAGSCFRVFVEREDNEIVVVVRGLPVAFLGDDASEVLCQAAVPVADLLKFQFPTGTRPGYHYKLM
eukprot:gnl/MRDRNA2_/MRDRNA2_421393_c0_seq1.p2 gnl/MRDRNA2_/MRDRNA2_421393_c0~~gnl/MRDRNA2_/MRDRNA2_421393_c0_seq1.p2  ORF type:complete len:153 (-),score=20.21 gnl/MRDRNA2_/MRDRNA2_421393_c0_seq1:486-920(-)